jgi:pyruvate formate lyase activating enzyme
MEAAILDIQRMSTEDGPGLRTTVFFKGCNLACPWCHNPESIGRKPDPVWYAQKCLGCNICGKICPQGSISRDEEGSIRFDRSRCLGCGSCAGECPGGAIDLKGRPMAVDLLFAELVKDRAYFGTGGGVTLSGGEVMMQHEAALVLARRLREAGIGVAVDTAGCYDFCILKAMLPYTDLILYDLKIFDAAEHRRITGSDNASILDNYRRLMETGARVWVRTPVIEGATGTAENIEALGRFIAGAGLPEKWELCAFNNLCRDKYERLDLDWAYKNTELVKREQIETLTAIAGNYVPGAVHSGATR